ncbi:MAG: fibrobacter succinogenes major paralogous domain-containing protein [Bacteroidales bacterium]|nr:fibrobacter succinogenes major paralogous domain-containing protein [Bacteroidales bacterium]
MKSFYKTGLLFIALIFTQQAFSQKQNSKDPLTGEQQIELSEGYSFVSSRIMAENPDMLAVMASVLNENLDFIRNSQGQVLRKIGPNWINGIGDWIIEEGYLVKMFTGNSFIIEGDIVDPISPIQLESGFQFISYFPENPMDALIAFETILGDNLDFVRNSQGQILRKIGPNWVNGIGDCNPGEGYLVRMLNDDVLIYPIIFGVPCPGMPTVTDIDGNTYNTVQIGVQCWMKENLKTTTYQNGTSIQNVTNAGSWNNLTTGAYVWYDNDITWKNLYGALYNWYAVDDPNGLCPTGWHVPTNDEWTALTDFIGGTWTPHGNELKSCRQVNSPLGEGCNTTEHPRWNEYNTDFGTDDYGFSGLPGGGRCYNSYFDDLGNFGTWWSSTEHLSNHAWYSNLNHSYGYVYSNHSYMYYGFSVRCLRD